jgi:hypothetical protein
VRSIVAQVGIDNIRWSAVAEGLPGRIGKQIRERWFNHLDPELKKGKARHHEQHSRVPPIRPQPIRTRHGSEGKGGAGGPSSLVLNQITSPQSNQD